LVETSASTNVYARVSGLLPEVREIFGLKAAAALLAVASLYPLVQADNVAGTDGSVVTATGGRDGYHWERPDRNSFLAAAGVPGTWNRGYLHPATGICMVVGDRLYFYFGAWSAETKKTRTCKFAPACSTVYAGGSTGVAMLAGTGSPPWMPAKRRAC
jgi:hypothetical protein